MAIDIEREIEEIHRDMEEGDDRPSPIWKYFRYSIALIMALLIITYLLVDPAVRDVVAGFFESSSVNEGDVFSHGEKEIIFNQGTYGQLVQMFRENQEHEFKACLLGTIDGDTYQVYEVHEPRVYSQSVYHVVSENCPSDTIIDLHSHPYQRCVASQTDLQSLESMKERKPDLLLAVMCTEERISFYG